jgi:NHS family xanthosine MFS transporter
MAIFFVLSILVGVALQINNTFVSGFLHDFDLIPRFRDAFGVTHSAIIMSLAQMSETLFILAIPFFLTRFGIKKVMLISIFAWVLRFGLLAYGDPSERIWLILLSMAIYGCAFDFFNISCAIFVDNETPAEMRAGAQGLFFIMTLGIGAFCGSYGGGIIVDALSSLHAGVMVRHWSQIWMVFAAYMLVVGIIVILFFKPKTKNVNSQQITH